MASVNDQNEKQPETLVTPQTQQPNPVPPPQKQRYDWYQTDTLVTINILIKKAKEEDVNIILTKITLSATVKQPTGSDYSLELDLAHPIVPEKSTTRILNSKIEIRLKKEEAIRWSKLEGEDNIPQAVKPAAETAEACSNAVDINKYPTSSHGTRNWDQIAKEFEKEEEENAKGEAALNSLFQKIYASGDEETQKAMNKSFVESAGTVLSTNWKDIGAKKTDIKPPDGMEHKQWDS
ncbi:protein SGT1 homolog isoform X1 [Strongylocentrotus purpuratus]|uniref:Suppressor of G2 allele of SKP1 homolog n=1 Tax=Strongylocentrotus purpuratus TaxID=7668 RepID=A0A7M7HL49_STRPU|nr:protein SGT1 homolog isoform X1 [Strongylocentrotus purpuratus]|eukprot:XP_011674642.1 PREDICTED: suppressor of G2 allele of SKP1 homolog isoform X1 [Strongylocentrotus purpuratus]